MNNEEIFKNLRKVMETVKSTHSIFVEFYIYYSVGKCYYFNSCDKSSIDLQSGISMFVYDKGKEYYYYTTTEEYELLILWLYRKYPILKSEAETNDNIILKKYGYCRNVFEEKDYLQKLKNFKSSDNKKLKVYAIHTNFELITIYNNFNYCMDGRAFQKIFFSDEKNVLDTISLNHEKFIGDMMNGYRYRGLVYEQETNKIHLSNRCIKKIILLPKASGALIHEVCGHMLERAFYNKRNCFYDKLEQKIAPSFFTVHDNPELLYGNMNHVDDEGFELKKNTIIESGILKGIIADEVYNMKENHFPCFRQSRRESHEYLSTGRMFCLEVEPGEQSQQEIIDKNNTNSIIISSFDKSFYDVATQKVYFQTNVFFVVDDRKPRKIEQILKICLKGQTILSNILELSNDNEYHENMCYACSGYVSNATFSPTIVLGTQNMKVKYHRNSSVTIK